LAGFVHRARFRPSERGDPQNPSLQEGTDTKNAVRTDQNLRGGRCEIIAAKSTFRWFGSSPGVAASARIRRASAPEFRVRPNLIHHGGARGFDGPFVPYSQHLFAALPGRLSPRAYKTGCGRSGRPSRSPEAVSGSTPPTTAARRNRMEEARPRRVDPSRERGGARRSKHTVSFGYGAARGGTRCCTTSRFPRGFRSGRSGWPLGRGRPGGGLGSRNGASPSHNSGPASTTHAKGTGRR